MKTTEIKDILYERFRRLEPCSADGNFTVEPLCSNMPHRLGVSAAGGPMLFVECSDSKVTTDICLKMFKVGFNRLCRLMEDGEPVEKKYCIIELNSQNMDIQKYFLEMTYLLLRRLPLKPGIDVLKQEVGKVISMFTAAGHLSKEVIKGLWAELLVIDQSADCEYMIRSWHETPGDKYDFNDASDKIEVKATGNEDRIHHFAMEQLQPNEGSRLLVCSVVIIPSGLGKNIMDLVDSIASRVTDSEVFFKLKSIVMGTIGNHIEDTKSARFDYEYGSESIRWYDHLSVPCIAKSCVPPQITRVGFSVCLKDIEVYGGKYESCLFEKANANRKN